MIIPVDLAPESGRTRAIFYQLGSKLSHAEN